MTRCHCKYDPFEFVTEFDSDGNVQLWSTSGVALSPRVPAAVGMALGNIPGFAKIPTTPEPAPPRLSRWARYVRGFRQL